VAVIILCKQCLASSTIAAGAAVEDVHEALRCGCCPGDHHHGHAAANCPRTHEGPCWQGPQSGPKPDGCTVCRPLLILAGAEMTPAGLGG
jgi:hypothetical protein